MNAPANEQLTRRLGLSGAIVTGIGSIVGTGVFVAMGLGAGVVGPAVTLAVVIAGVLALCNALSSAQLAAAHPVAGGTYEYGYRLLSPPAGFMAGWMFLCAKSASAATAGLALAGYLLGRTEYERATLVIVALVIILVLTIAVIAGIRRVAFLNTAIVTTTIAALAILCIAALPTALESARVNMTPYFPADSSPRDLLYAAALVFVAFTGYGRIATLGEEVRNPRRTIPRAVVLALGLAATLYLAVGLVAIAVVGPGNLEQATRDGIGYRIIATAVDGPPWLHACIVIGAATAMIGVLMNLLLGLSRVLLAMGRRSDMPAVLARLDATRSSPRIAVIVTGVIVAGLTLVGDLRATWSFSALTVLIYYAITNIAALRLQPADRLYPRLISWAGLAGCLALGIMIPWQTWSAGLAVLLAGAAWFLVANLRRSRGPRAKQPA